MEDYKSNSDKARQEQQSEKKVEAVITGAAKTRGCKQCQILYFDGGHCACCQESDF